MKLKHITALALCAVLSFLMSGTAFANSAQKWWSGADSYGTIITDAECPVVVESELLTFDISDFPKSSYSDKDIFLAYEASVTAQYTFYNPADYTVTAKLEFPFGMLPQYAGNIDDVNKYDITINGSAIKKTVRHTLMKRNYDLDPLENLSMITDGYMEDSFYYPDLPVTKYVYKIIEYDEKYKNAGVAVDFPDLPAYRGKLLFKEMSGYEPKHDLYRARTWASNGKTLTLYVFGRQFDDPPEWKFYRDSKCNDREEISGSAELVSADGMTFMDFVMSGYPEDSYILESDWYNAMVADLRRSNIGSYDYSSIISDSKIFNLKNWLLRWYEYEITLAPGERIVNTVTAPIYPSINERFSSPVYNYTYLLSPAKTWADFGPLEIVINTPFYLIDNDDFDKSEFENKTFEKTETGYQLSLDGLPDGELEFSLSASKKPVSDNFAFWIALLVLGLGLLVFVALIIAAIVIVCQEVRRKR